MDKNAVIKFINDDPGHIYDITILCNDTKEAAEMFLIKHNIRSKVVIQQRDEYKTKWYSTLNLSEFAPIDRREFTPIDRRDLATPVRKLYDNNIGKAFVFDFDLTLSTTHTNGYPRIYNEINIKPIDEVQIYNILTNFRLIKNNHPDNKIIILSRGSYLELEYYFKEYPNIRSMIDNIYGASSYENINKSSLAWGFEKLRILDIISKQSFSHPSAYIHFFDDTQQNIDIAKQAGYFNSHHIDNPSNVFANLDKCMNSVIDLYEFFMAPSLEIKPPSLEIKPPSNLINLQFKHDGTIGEDIQKFNEDIDKYNKVDYPKMRKILEVKFKLKDDTLRPPLPSQTLQPPQPLLLSELQQSHPTSQTQQPLLPSQTLQPPQLFLLSELRQSQPPLLLSNEKQSGGIRHIYKNMYKINKSKYKKINLLMLSR